MKKVSLDVALLYKKSLEQKGYKYTITLNKYCTDRIFIFINGKIQDNEKCICIEENMTYAEHGQYTCVIRYKKIFMDYMGYFIHIYKGKKLYLRNRDFI